MTPWLRANRAGLIAIAVALPLLAVLLVPVQLIGVTRTEVVEEVPAGASGRLDGLRYSVIAADEFGRTKGLTTPAGTTLVAAVVEVRTTDQRPVAATCSFTLSAPGAGGRADWDPQQPFDSARYGYRRGDGFAADCSAAPTGRYRAEVVFLAPEGTARGASVDVTAPGAPGTTQVLRLRLPAAPAPTAAALPAR